MPISFRIKHSLPRSRSPVSHSPIPNSIISPHLSLTPETLVLDIGKHTFNYPWPHISLKYLHCTPPQGDTVHDLSPNLFICHLLGRDLWPQCFAICIHFVVKSWASLVVMFATRHGCQIEVLSRKDMGLLLWFRCSSCGFLPFLAENTHSLRKAHTGFRCLL